MSYSLQDGNNREWGIGTVAAGNVLNRTTITGTLVAGTYTTGGAALTLSGGTSLLECVEHEGSALDTIDNADALRLKVSDVYPDFVASGLVTGTSVSLSGVMTPGVAYVVGTRVEKLIADATLTFTYAVSSDTYNDISNAGVITHVAVANGAAAPAVTANSIRLEKVVTSGTAITSVVRLAAGRSLPVAVKDSVTGTTVLMVGGVAISPTGISLTVGVGGKYPTIQAALDYISTQPAFLPINLETMQPVASDLPNGTALAWSQNASDITISAAPKKADTSSITVMPTARQTWLKLAADSYYYPLENYGNAASGVDVLTHLSTNMRRIESNMAAPSAFYWYKENTFTVLLLDEFIKENVTFAANCCVTFRSMCNTVWHGTMTQSPAFKSGKLRFENIRMGGDHGTVITNWTSNTIAMEFFRGEIDQTFEDFIFPSTLLGSFLSQYTVWNHQPTNTAGNAINPTCVGDIVIQDVIWNVLSHGAVDALPNDAFLVDKCSARNIIVDGVNGNLKDRFNQFDDIAIIGPNMNAMAGKIVVENASLISLDATASKFNIVEVSANLSGSTIQVDRCGIHAPSGSGALRLVRVASAPTSATTVKIGRGNNIEMCEAAANLTYTKATGVSGTATVASASTSVVVTHGLGYAPNASDITIIPTLLSTSAKWWVTAIGAATFQINVDVAPGAGTATFAWRTGV
jgi:hypothetical protein